METVNGIETITAKDKERKPLHMLQPAANDNEILVGTNRIFKSIQSKGEKTKSIVKTKKRSIPICKKVTKRDKAIQTVQEKIEIEVDDLISPANPSENYWQSLAEKRRMALADTLNENKTLYQRIKTLEEENQIYKEMLDETKTLVEVLQEEMKEMENERNDINNLLDDSAV